MSALSKPGVLDLFGKCFKEVELCDRDATQAGFSQGSVQLFLGCFPFIHIVLISLLGSAQSFSLLYFSSAPLAPTRLGVMVFAAQPSICQ